MIKNTNKIIPVKSYFSAGKFKTIIYKENTRKPGIYLWTNKINGKSYVGSAQDLTKRIKYYYCSSGLINYLSKSNSKIYSSLLKYGYNNFSLKILEYCELTSLTKREQYYLNLLDPEYNILKTAYSRTGRKVSKKTKVKKIKKE